MLPLFVTYAVFVVEHIECEVMCLNLAAWQETWNWFDLLLVLMWVADRAMENLPFDTSLLRLLRLARLIRLVSWFNCCAMFSKVAAVLFRPSSHQGGDTLARRSLCCVVIAALVNVRQS